MGFNEQLSVPGVLESTVNLGMDGALFDEYVYDLSNSRVAITKIGYGGGGEPPQNVFETTVGNNTQTVFDIDAGFATAGATIYLYDTINENLVHIFDQELGVPTSTSVRLTLTPAPATGQIEVVIFG